MPIWKKSIYDTLVYCIQNLKADDFETKRKRAEDIGREYSDGGVDAMENMFYSIEFRVKDEIGQTLSRIVRGGTG